MIVGISGLIFGLIIKPRIVAHDTHGTDCVAVHDADANLFAADISLDQNRIIKVQRIFARRTQFRHIGYQRDPQARSFTGRFDHDRKAKCAVYLLQIIELISREGIRGWRGQVMDPKDFFGFGFVHRQRACEHAAPGIRNPHHLQQPLDAPIFAVATM